mgnify:CR=1 FL=1
MSNYRLLLLGNDNGQAMLFAELVRGAANFVVAALVGMVMLLSRKADGIPNYTIMGVPTANVGARANLYFP